MRRVRLYVQIWYSVTFKALSYKNGIARAIVVLETLFWSWFGRQRIRNNHSLTELLKGLFGSSVGGEMEASSQRADIELTLPFGSSSFISCSDRSSWASSRQARLHPCNCLNRLLVRLKNVSLKNIGGDHNLNKLELPFCDTSERLSRASTVTFCQDVDVVVLRPLIKLAMPPTP